MLIQYIFFIVLKMENFCGYMIKMQKQRNQNLLKKIKSLQGQLSHKGKLKIYSEENDMITKISNPYKETLEQLQTFEETLSQQWEIKPVQNTYFEDLSLIEQEQKSLKILTLKRDLRKSKQTNQLQCKKLDLLLEQIDNLKISIRNIRAPPQQQYYEQKNINLNLPKQNYPLETQFKYTQSFNLLLNRSIEKQERYMFYKKQLQNLKKELKLTKISLNRLQKNKTFKEILEQEHKINQQVENRSKQSEELSKIKSQVFSEEGLQKYVNEKLNRKLTLVQKTEKQKNLKLKLSIKNLWEFIVKLSKEQLLKQMEKIIEDVGADKAELLSE